MLSCARASLPVVGVVNAKAVLKHGVDVILEYARQINRVFFEVIKRSNRVKEGAVVHLSAQLDCITVGVDIALPNMLEYVVWLD